MHLPNELWLMIAERTSIAEVVTLLQVNSNLYQLMHSSLINKFKEWSLNPTVVEIGKKCYLPASQISCYRINISSELGAVEAFFTQHKWNLSQELFWKLALEFTQAHSVQIRRFLLIHAFYLRSTIEPTTWYHFILKHQRDAYLQFSLEALDFNHGKYIFDTYLRPLFKNALKENNVSIARMIYQYGRACKYRQNHALWYIVQKGYSVDLMYNVCLPSLPGEYCWSNGTPEKQIKFIQELHK